MKISKFLHEGVKKELEFAQLLVQLYGGKIYKSTINDDIHKHVDLWWEYNGKIVGFDVKALKKQSRNDNSYDSNIHWIELKNVNGKPGWIFGESDYIVFEGINMWIVVKRKVLLAFLRQTVNFDIIHNSSSNLALYELYRRNGRKDLICKVSITDLLKLKSKIIMK